MNKKVLTLCAGVLLVGGSAIFTVNAVNAGNGKAQTAYVADLRAGEVVGYGEIVPADADAATNQWSLVSTTGGYYLSPATGWYVAKDYTIRPVEGNTPDIITIDEDGFLKFGENDWMMGEKHLYLWKDAKILTWDKAADATSVELATAKDDIADLAVGVQYAAIVSNDNLSVSLFNGKVEGSLVNAWTLASNKLKIGSGTYLTVSNGTLSITTTETEAGYATYDGKNLFVNGQIVYIAESGLSTSAENALPAAFYAVDEDNKVTLEPTTTAVTEGTFVVAQRIDTQVPDVKYATSAVEGLTASAPGAEYGTIPGVQINDKGELAIQYDGVANVPAPVYISTKVGDETRYLGMNGDELAWVAEANRIAWVLENGTLKNLNAEKAGAEPEDYNVASGVSFAPSILNGVSIAAGQQISYSLARVSVLAANPLECDYPLQSTIPGTDYIYIGGTVGSTTYYFKLNGDITTNIAEAELWKVNTTTENYGRIGYTFQSRTNPSQYLTVDGATRFTGWAYTGGVQLVATDNNTNNGNVVLSSTGADIDNTLVTRATVLGFYQSALAQYDAHWLLHRYGSSFKLNVVEKYKNIADKTIWGNEFADADLVPVVVDANGELHEIVSENDTYGGRQQFLLKKKGTNLYIVLNVSEDWSNAVESFVQGGYKFEVLSEANVKDVLATGSVNGKNYYPYFQINYLEGKTEVGRVINGDAVEDNTPAHCIEVGYRTSTGTYVFEYDLANLETTNTQGHLDVYVSVVDNCAHDDARMPQISFYTDNENIVRGEDSANNPLLYKYVNISFKSGANMQFQNEENSWVNLNGKVLGINKEGYAAPTEPEYFLADKSEGMWYVTMTDAEGLKATDNAVNLSSIDSRKFTFTNRENPEVTLEVKVMHALGNDVYAVEYDDASQFPQYWPAWYNRPFGYQTINGNRNQVMRDTLIIKAADIDKAIAKGAAGLHNMDSYANWTKEDLQDKTFQLSIDAAAQLYVTENEGKDSHFLGLSSEEADVTNWRLVPFTAARVHDTDAVKYLTAGTDSVYVMAHPQYYSNGKFYAYNDTTAIITYALQNIQNNEWLTYDPSQSQTIESMICDPNSKNYTTANLNEAYRFVLKEKAEGAQKIESGAYNIIGVDAWELDADKYVKGGADAAYYTLDLSKKLYGATSYQKLGAVEVEGAYEQPTSNDIFTIATTASQEYVKATPMDTVRIYGAEENDYLLYENGQFLNMGNKAGIAPAMVLDTAYYNRPGNNRYQYLIVLNPNYVPAVPCEIEGHPALHPDTMYGRFLVNQIDSAVMVSRNHNNKFINDIEADEKELKLGFQWGYRTGDKLYLTAGKDGKVIETIDLSTPDFNKAKFAFKYVNEAVDKQFKVQTAWYDYDSAVKAGLDNKDAWTWNNEGYLRSVNGVIVVTNGYTHGEEFLMAQENSDPTANESINASSVVVAGVDGAVVVKGAEGKNVIVSTILGKVVANEVVSSDNATIAAPAGIVVVSVDGESFKVVVK